MAASAPRQAVLKQCYERALATFCARDLQLLATRTHEQAIAHRLALYLEQECRALGNAIDARYVVDCEYNRNGNAVKRVLNGNSELIEIRADLILHSRGQILEQDNLLAIELKMMPKPQRELNNDRERLKAMTENTFGATYHWRGGKLPETVCRYKFGVYLLIHVGAGYIDQEYFFDGQSKGSGPRIDVSSGVMATRRANAGDEANE